MSGGTGFDPLDSILNVGSQVLTYGLVGYGDKGLKAGLSGEPIVKGAKDLTGATAAEDANNIARDQFDQAKAQAATDRANVVKQNQNTQLQKSNSATSAKGTVTPQTGKTSSQVLGDTSSFLGL